MHKILFPEANNHTIIAAAAKLPKTSAAILEEQPLETAFKKLSSGEVDTIVVGHDFTSRDVIIAARDILGLRPGQKTFSSLFVCKFLDGRELILTDGAACKNPTALQLADIAILAYEVAQKIFQDEPRLACLSFSTAGSGGKDPSIEKITEAIALVRAKNPEIKIDGEMQLDSAINPQIGAKKFKDSPVAGKANVLIAPDLNSGNLLYKSFEQLAGATIAGPILLGFNKPLSDLSRGSTSADVVYTVECLEKLI